MNWVTVWVNEPGMPTSLTRPRWRRSIPAPGTAAYNISKAGILALSETLYAELLPHRVGVTVICPSFFKSNLLDDARFAGHRWRSMFQHAMGRQ